MFSFMKTAFNADKNEYFNRSYSQEGEDLVLMRIFPPGYKGFYVDVGAHHPLRFSNTYLLNSHGWRGINIDATPGSMDLFKKLRPHDINLEIGISDVDGICEFYVFEELALNTFNAKVAAENITCGCRLKHKSMVKTRRLTSVLEEFLPALTNVDLLTIDVEGLDQLVLQSLDLARFRPKVIVCELISNDLMSVMNSVTAELLTEHGYILYSKLFHSCIWVQKDMLL